MRGGGVGRSSRRLQPRKFNRDCVMKRRHLQREPNLRPNFKYVATKPKKVGLLNISAKQLDQQFINTLIQVAVDFKLIREIDAQSVSYIPGKRLIDFRKASPPFSKEMNMKNIARALFLERDEL